MDAFSLIVSRLQQLSTSTMRNRLPSSRLVVLILWLVISTTEGCLVLPIQPPPPPPPETTTGSRFSVLHCLVCLIPAIFRLPLSFLAPSQTTFVVAMLFTFDVFLSLSTFFFHTSTFYFFSLALIKK